MLHFYFGTDTPAIRQNAFRAVDELCVPGVQLTRINTDDFSPGMVANLLGASSLFGGIELFLFDTPSENTDLYTELIASAAAMAESRNIFMVIEGALLAASYKPFEKHATVFSEIKRAQEIRFDVFKMAEALSRRDKKSLWVLLQEARQFGISAEELIGTLWWQLKTLRLAAVTNNAVEAGMKEYPYNKAKRALQSFKVGELEKLSLDLLRVYHDGHGGMRDINEGLEEWVLRG